MSRRIRETVRVGKKYRYNEPNDLSAEKTMEDFLYIDPSDINPNILKNGTGDLNKEQQKALKALLHIKKISKRYEKGVEREDAIKRLKQDIRDELNPNSSFNSEVNKVIKKFTEGLSPLSKRKSNNFTRDMEKRIADLSKGGNRRTRRRM
jgi:ribosomal protein S20